MDIRDFREKLTMIMSDCYCYAQEGSACPTHPVFQPQKAINEILSLIKEEGYVKRELLNQQWIEELENMHLNNCQVWSGGDCDCGIERLKLNLKSKMEAENER